jgi:hypothetical protein
MTSHPTARPMSGETVDSLKVELTSAKRDLLYLEKRYAVQASEVTRLNEAFDHLSLSYSARTTEAQEINELRAVAESKLAKARDVIRPFALIPDNIRPDASDYHQVKMNLGWLRAARAFLEEK